MRLVGIALLTASVLVLSQAARAQTPAADSCGAICLLDAQNHAIDAAQAALEVSPYVTNGSTLPSGTRYDETSLGATDVRVQIDDAVAELGAQVELESRTARGVLRGKLRLALGRPAPGLPLRSPFVRLVADEVDLHAKGAQGRVLAVALRDKVIVRYQRRGLQLEQTLRVGRPGSDRGSHAARQTRLAVHILRLAPHGPPVIGNGDLDALEIMRKQVTAANQIWLQCDLTFGDPSEVAVEIVDPPPPTLLAVSDEDGLPARGGGELRFLVNGRVIGPLYTSAGATPLATATAIADALRAAGFYPNVRKNLATRGGAGPSADVLVRKLDGSAVTITPDGKSPLSTDARQTLSIGAVDLSDGLREFDNMTAQVGSLEERTLLGALSDGDNASIDIFVVNQFTGATRQGEAFIAEPSAVLRNSVVIDRNGLKHLPLAWTLAHEIGHVLMDDPLHPDNIGPDRPWLLMDSDSGRGTVDGPKRLRPEDCQRVRSVAQRATTPLLTPYDTQRAE